MLSASLNKTFLSLSVQAFHGIVSDVIGIAAGRTKVPTPVSSPTHAGQNPLEEPKHLSTSVYVPQRYYANHFWLTFYANICL